MGAFQSFDAWLNKIVLRSRWFTEKNWQYLCVISGSLCALTFFLAFVAADFLPPISPSWGAEHVHQHYWTHVKGVRAGAALMMLSGGFYIPYSAVISKQMRMIPNVDPILCDLQLASCAAGIFSFIVPSIILALVTFRDYGPELTLLISDFFWLSAIMQWPTFWMQSWSVGWAIFADDSPEPVFPKTMGLINFIAPLTYSSVTGVHTTLTGPYAWNGGLTFWLGMVFFGASFGIDSYCLLKNIKNMPDVKGGAAPNLPTSQAAHALPASGATSDTASEQKGASHATS